jgi:hypothetical protein
MHVLTNLKDTVATDSPIGRQLLHEIMCNISGICAERASAISLVPNPLCDYHYVTPSNVSANLIPGIQAAGPRSRGSQSS